MRFRSDETLKTPVALLTGRPDRYRCAWHGVLLLIAISLIAADAPKGKRLYLDEFRPKTELKSPENILTRAKFPCINVHTHPQNLTGAEVDEMVRVMDASNIPQSVSLDGPAGPRFREHYDKLNGRHPGRFLVFVRMDFQGDGDAKDMATWDVNKPDFGPRMADKLTDAVKNGACGLKLLKTLGLGVRDAKGKLIAVDDPRFDPVWQRAGELKIPVLIHTADPIAFFRPIDEKNERWEELYRHPEWSFHGKDYPQHQELIDARNRVIARHPKTTFLCAHMADIPEDLAKLGEYLDQYPNMMVEISARISELGRQPYTARKFFLKYPDRILFGTDGVPPVSELVPHWRFLETWDEFFPYEDNPFPPQGFWNIYGIGLPDEVLKKVYYENAHRIIPGAKTEIAADTPPIEPVTLIIETPAAAEVKVAGTLITGEEVRRARIRPLKADSPTSVTVSARWMSSGQERLIVRPISANPGATLKVTFHPDDLTADEQRIVDLTNAARAQMGQRPLAVSHRLARASRLHSTNMAAKGQMSHDLDGQTFSDRVQQTGYVSRAGAENIAASQRTPEEAVQSWLNSPGHRVNMLGGQFTQIGVGIATAPNGSKYYTQVFGTP